MGWFNHCAPMNVGKAASSITPIRICRLIRLSSRSLSGLVILFRRRQIRKLLFGGAGVDSGGRFRKIILVLLARSLLIALAA